MNPNAMVLWSRLSEEFKQDEKRVVLFVTADGYTYQVNREPRQPLMYTVPFDVKVKDIKEHHKAVVIQVRGDERREKPKAKTKAKAKASGKGSKRR